MSFLYNINNGVITLDWTKYLRHYVETLKNGKNRKEFRV